VIVLIGFLVAGGVVCLVGAAEKERRKPLHKRGVFVNGTAALAKGARVVWRKPGLVLDRVAVSYLAGGLVVVTVVLATRPDQIWKVVAVVVAALLVGAVAWDHKVTGGRPWGEVLARISREEAGRAALATTHPDAKAGTVKVRGDRLEIPVAHVGPIDAERVGQALHAPHVELVPGSELGRSTVVVHDTAPAGEVDPWAALATVHRWPGPSSTHPDAPIPVAVDVHGRAVSIAVPGDGGKHLLVAGSTGAGKSVFLSVVLAELAFRDVELRFADPKLVEFAAWAPRAEIARGVEETGTMLDAIHDEMMTRYQSLEGTGRRQWAGRRLILVIDELSAVTTGKTAGPRIQKLGLILAMGRAAGIGLVICTQRPSREVIPLDLRDNTRVRVGLGCESPYQTEMILGDQTKWLCHEIPESMPGTAYVRVDRHATLCRSYLLTDDDIDRVAAATSHLKGV
jgi:hypothetical protein